MTVLKRTTPKKRTGRGKPPPIDKKFPVDTRVQVDRQYHDVRYADRIGKVIKTDDERTEIYPRGRVGVIVFWDELHHKLFGSKAPRVVWFKPNDLDKVEYE